MYKKDFNVMTLAKEIRQASSIFVGGSRRAGKTTCSCAIAIQMAKKPGHKVLLVSIKSVHNVSDVFVQQFSKVPTTVNGIDNLLVIEVDPPTRKKRNTRRNESRVSQHLGKRLFESFHNGKDIDFALKRINKVIKDNNVKQVVWDTAASVEHYGLWPFERKKSFFLELKDLFVPKYEGMCFDNFKYDVCNREITRKLNFMTKKYHLQSLGRRAFVYVDTVNPLHAPGTKILLNNLTQHGFNTYIIINRLTSEYLPPSEEGGLWPLPHITKVPLMIDRIIGVDEMRYFSKCMMVPYFEQFRYLDLVTEMNLQNKKIKPGVKVETDTDEDQSEDQPQEQSEDEDEEESEDEDAEYKLYSWNQKK